MRSLLLLLLLHFLTPLCAQNSQHLQVFGQGGANRILLFELLKEEKGSWTFCVQGNFIPLPLDSLQEQTKYLIRSTGYHDLEFTKTQVLEQGGKLFLQALAVQLPDYSFMASPLEVAQSPREVLRLNQNALERLQPQTTASWLEASGSVFVQRSQMGGGSPILRGFEASRILIVVDGVRLNNAIFRSGHLQNIIRLDAHMQNQVEVLFGPGSVAYGSDALGGVLHFSSLPLSFRDSAFLHGKTAARFSSANLERNLHATALYGKKKWAGLTALTFSDFGDLRQGAWQDPRDSGRWDNLFTVRSLDGQDTAFLNPNPNLQRRSGYSQVNLLQKLGYQGKKYRHEFNLQYSTTTNVPRYDRLTDTSQTGKPLYATWNYGPETYVQAAFHSSKKLGT